MLRSIQNNDEQESEEANTLRVQFEAILEQKHTADDSNTSNSDEVATQTESNGLASKQTKTQITNFFEIKFNPESHYLHTV